MATGLYCYCFAYGAMIDRLGLRRSLLITPVLVSFSCMMRGFDQGQLTLLLTVAFLF